MTPAAEGSSAQSLADDRAAPERERAARGRTASARAPLGTARRTDGSVASSAIPRRRAVATRDRGGQRIGQRRAGARDAVVEAQHPDPAAWKHVMQRGVVGG